MFAVFRECAFIGIERQAMIRATQRLWKHVLRAQLQSLELSEELVLWDFRQPDSLREWNCISDKDMGGYSAASIEPNGKGTGAKFHGYLNPQRPPGSSPRYSGYCAIRSKPRKDGWMESGLFDLAWYDALHLRVRGDGRRFIANISAPSMGRKDDIWQSFVFTRGGPEWEDITLPFSEFFLTNRGYMQDHQTLLPTASISTVGLLLADKVAGPFELELQSIKVVAGTSFMHKTWTQDYERNQHRTQDKYLT